MTADINPRERRGLIVAGITGFAIPWFKGMSFLLSTGVFGRPGDPASGLPDGMLSFLSLLCNLLGFYLPVIFLAAAIMGLRPILGRSRALSLAGVVLILLTVSSLYLEVPFHTPAFPAMEVLREGARWFYFWYLPPVAILIGLACFQPAHYGQFLFSLMAAVLMAIIHWLSMAMDLIEQTSMVVDTFWYIGTGAWLMYLSQTISKDCRSGYGRLLST